MKSALKQARHWARQFLTRPLNANKYHLGHVLVIGGSRAMPGAAALCGWAALRAGAGLVTVALPASACNFLKKNWHPETMLLSLPETRKGVLGMAAFPQLCRFILARKVRAVVIGPGLGRAACTQKLLDKLNRALKSNLQRVGSVVWDADALAAIAHLKMPLAGNSILTPHEGEAAHLLPREHPRSLYVRKIAKCYNALVVLKGHKTLVSDGKTTFENQSGNPGLAKAGTGDVLAGMIGAIVSQAGGGLPGILPATALAVYLHGLAADIAVKKLSQTALTASDVVEALPAAFKRIETPNHDLIKL